MIHENRDPAQGVAALAGSKSKCSGQRRFITQNSEDESDLQRGRPTTGHKAPPRCPRITSELIAAIADPTEANRFAVAASHLARVAHPSRTTGARRW